MGASRVVNGAFQGSVSVCLTCLKFKIWPQDLRGFVGLVVFFFLKLEFYVIKRKLLKFLHNISLSSLRAFRCQHKILYEKGRPFYMEARRQHLGFGFGFLKSKCIVPVSNVSGNSFFP